MEGFRTNKIGKSDIRKHVPFAKLFSINLMVANGSYFSSIKTTSAEVRDYLIAHSEEYIKLIKYCQQYLFY